MNIGTFLYDLFISLINFGKNATTFFTAKIDISKLISALDFLNIDTLNIPTELSLFTIIGSFGGVVLLTIFAIKIFK